MELLEGFLTHNQSWVLYPFLPSSPCHAYVQHVLKHNIMWLVDSYFQIYSSQLTWNASINMSFETYDHIPHGPTKKIRKEFCLCLVCWFKIHKKTIFDVSSIWGQPPYKWLTVVYCGLNSQLVRMLDLPIEMKLQIMKSPSKLWSR